ncbi:MAG: family 16 glycoside hydrolase [Dysgonomonas sp.]
MQSCAKKTIDATILVNAAKVENSIPAYLHGSCMEDVNHEIYGGLYDQKIFGESFEEPAPSPSLENFSTYEGAWTTEDNQLSVQAFPGAKLIYNTSDVNDGDAEVEVKFDSNRGDNAGFITHVSRSGNGADNFYGYEISLAADGRKVVLGKHKHNFEHIRDISVDCDPIAWNRLKIAMDKGRIEIFLNGKSIYVHNDNDDAIQSGKIGLRTWNSDVKFRNLKIKTNNIEEKLAFKTTPQLNISSLWDGIQTGDAKAIFTHDNEEAYNGDYSQIIELISGDGVVGISNSSLNRWGIAVNNGQKLEGRLYLKSPNLQGTVSVALQSADGKTEYARQEISNITNEWKKYPFELISDTDDTKARFVIYINQPGKLWIDQVVLMNIPKNQFKGLPYRKDIGEMIVNEGLSFLRYGGTMINAPEYRFKKMIGDPDKRPPYKGHWYRYSTNGFGIEDFLKFCEAAGFTASFAINIEETPEDMADMIEYLNGGATTEWGGKRAENGHPEPYNVKYIGIGNEEVLFNGDRADEYDHYIERFNLIYDAIKSKDPSVSLINTAWWRPNSPNVEKVFRALDGKADYWDYHPWADKLTNGMEVERELKRMQELFLKWNPNTTMKCAIFEENGNLHNMQRVLGHVTVRNAVRRMGDFVLTSCAANALQPYQQNDNGWDQGQIFFTPSQVWGMPPFYAQQMSSKNHLPLRVFSSADAILDVTATRDESGNRLVLHIANTHDKTIATKLNISDFDNIKEAKAISLSGRLDEVNTPEEPERIIPKEKQLNYKENMIYEFEPYSYTILVFSK